MALKSVKESEMHDLNHYIQKNQKLEQELEEMTLALSQAWDQLVPFLQDIPETTQAEQDTLAMLQAISVAADCDIVGIYLFDDDYWSAYPVGAVPTRELLDRLTKINSDIVGKFEMTGSGYVLGAATPIISEGETIGALGIVNVDLDRNFTAVDFRILHRMAERIGSQIAVAQLATLRERAALQARELQIANEIQQSVQPVDFPKHKCLAMTAFWQPAKEVGGDAWGWAQQETSRISWFVFDVAGKGLPAALAAVSLHTAISMALRMKLSPIETLDTINEQFYDAYTRTDLMATVAILSLDTSIGRLEIANAGHPPILIRQNKKWLQLEATSPPIGVLPDSLAITQTTTLTKNDLVITYSDGFSEIELSDGSLWGNTRATQGNPNRCERH